MDILYVADMLWSYCVGEGLAPLLDETLIPGFWVSCGNPTNNRLIQLSQRERESRHEPMYNHDEDNNVLQWLIILSPWCFIY